MASKSLNVLKYAKKLFKFKKFYVPKFTRANHSVPKQPLPQPFPIRYQPLQTGRRERNWIWNLATNFLFRNPQFNRFIRVRPIRLGFCFGLALGFNNPHDFPQINDIAGSCLHSSIKQERNFQISSLRDLKIGDYLTKGCEGAVYAARPAEFSKPINSQLEDCEQNPLVLKVLFNYREALEETHQDDNEIFHSFKASTIPLSLLPPHPSVTEVHGAVVEPMPHLPKAETEFPCALPSTLNPNIQECFGEEKTLFLVMKRYPSSLYDILQERALSNEECMQVLLQLLEGDVFLKKYQVAHRDLNTKNILIQDTRVGLRACINDFGCATDRLKVNSKDKRLLGPGIPALQAPEVANLESISLLDYSKADLWTIGTLVYDMYQPGSNPFKGGHLDARFYDDFHLPTVENAPPWMNSLVHAVLRKDPCDRPSSRICADVLHLMTLEFPPSWIFVKMPTIEQFRDWLILKLVDLIMKHRDNHMVYFHLTFLSRITEKELKISIEWLQSFLAGDD